MFLYTGVHDLPRPDYPRNCHRTWREPDHRGTRVAGTEGMAEDTILVTRRWISLLGFKFETRKHIETIGSGFRVESSN